MKRRNCWPIASLFLLMPLLCLMAQAARAANPRDWPQTSLGDKESFVKPLQYLLRARGYKVTVDGHFGTQTKNAVLKFQKSHHLIADGVVGNATWESLIVKVKMGSKGDAVRAIQVQLRGEGYAVPMSGSFGRQTVAAVKKFQGQRGLAKDGIVGSYTWCELVGGNTTGGAGMD